MKGTEKQRRWIPDLIDAYDIKSIADIGAGDLNWIKSMDIPNSVHYQAYDLVPRKPEVVKFDLVRQVPPVVDMVMCLWVLNHLPYIDAVAAVANLKASGARYLLMTHREKYRADQPPVVDMPFIEHMVLNDRGDDIRLVDLSQVRA